MPLELCLTFPDPSRVSVALRGEIEGNFRSVDFASPLIEDDLKELRWYVEDYGTGYRAEPDDQRAATVRDKLSVWGSELSAAVFKADDEAAKLFDHFLEAKKEGRILSIASDRPAVLSLPWELLVAPNGSFLFNETPPISIRRGLPAAEQESARQSRAAKPVLHLLFIISRPEGAGFINPRSDAEAVLAALEQQDAARVEVEFFRLATLGELKKRLQDSTKPPVDIIHFDGHGVLADSDSGGKEGQLLFESEWGGIKEVSGKELGDLLNSSHTGLVVLSACQSAMMDNEDPMSGVAAQLVHAGIPAVIAMSYSALVTTTELLFIEFYRSLFKGRTVARSLDEARQVLCSNLERGKRLRGAHNAQEITLELHDWFLSALYQSGADQPLFSTASDASLATQDEPLHNLPDVQESGFFGRSWELWQIERFFVVNSCRRISITGFGGQGKTALALEAGRWLLRTKLFQRACLVRFDSYQGSDPVSMAVSTMSAVFEESLPDAAAAEASLERVPTLLILDNLETLADRGTLVELLDTAAQWSEGRESRVLFTTRQPDFQHPAYPLASKQEHRQIALQGLREDDAVDWFDEMYRLPPEANQPRPQRDMLVSLFEKVDFHPLSIGLLAQQLKERRPAELGERLEVLLEEQPANREDRSLLVSLELSLERLPERCRKWLPRFGVFQSGGLEEIVKTVTGMEDYPSDWSILCHYLMFSGLMQAEKLPEVNKIWLRFHPTLSPSLWQKLNKYEHVDLLESYWQAYYELSKELYKMDDQTPKIARDVAKAELPNLIRATYISLAANSDHCTDFSENVTRFFNLFGLRREQQALSKEVAKITTEAGSHSWYLSQCNLGRQLLQNGQPEEAIKIFQTILIELKQGESYERCLTFGRIGRCYEVQGRLSEAEKAYRSEINGLLCLEQDKKVRREFAVVQGDLADVLRKQGNYAGAEEAYKTSLKIFEEQEDLRNIAVGKGQLGTLAFELNDLQEAKRRYQEALVIFRQLKEPMTEAVCFHELGIVYYELKQWVAAEQAFRESARIEEEQGSLQGAAESWRHLAQVCEAAGRIGEAEIWYQKALGTFEQFGDQLGTVNTYNDLIRLLLDQTDNGIDRLNDAQIMIDKSLAIAKLLDPEIAEIWVSYSIISKISEKNGDSKKASKYRAKARQAYAEFQGVQEKIQQHEKLITGVVKGSDVETALASYDKAWASLKVAIHHILNGERDETTLSEPLDYEEAAIIRAILEGIDGAA